MTTRHQPQERRLQERGTSDEEALREVPVRYNQQAAHLETEGGAEVPRTTAHSPGEFGLISLGTLYTEPPQRTGTHTHFSRARVTSHSCALCMAHVVQGATSPRRSQCSTLISFRNVFAERPASSVPSCVVLDLCSAIKTLSIAGSRCNSPSAPARWSESG